MKILLISYHVLNGTSEGLVTGKLIATLSSDHKIFLITNENPNVRSRLKALGATMKNITISSIQHDEKEVAFLWRKACMHESYFGNKMCAAMNIVAGCNAKEYAWVKAAGRAAKELVKKEHIAVMHSRLNPVLSHLVALQVKKRFPSLKWVAYFSDPWPLYRYPLPYQFTEGNIAKKRATLIMNKIKRKADSIIVPSLPLKDYLFPGLKKVYCIPHLSTYASKKKKRDASYLIRHAGFLMKERKLDAFFEAMRKIACPKMSVEFVGRYEVPINVPKALKQQVCLKEAMPPEDVEAWLQDADSLLLVEAAMDVGLFFPSKLADYLALRKPIIALSPSKGVVASFLSKKAQAEPQDVDAIARLLSKSYALWESGNLDELIPLEEQAGKVSPKRIKKEYEELFT